MSRAQFETLSTFDGTKQVPVASVVDGTAKAWARYNEGFATQGNKFFNVASITRFQDSAGTWCGYRVVFTNPMPDNNYAVTCGVSAGNGITNNVDVFTDANKNVVVPTVNGFQAVVFRSNEATYNYAWALNFAVFD